MKNNKLTYGASVFDFDETVGLSENVIYAALTNNVERVMFISTDKAVRPTSVMGASKRIAEMIVQDTARRFPGRMFSSQHQLLIRYCEVERRYLHPAIAPTMPQ